MPLMPPHFKSWMLLFGFLLCISQVFASIPSDWQARVDQANMLYNDSDVDVQFMTSIGNGYVATVINSDSMYISGIYNGPAISENNPSHRARIPSTVAISVVNGETQHCAIDIERGIYFRRSSVPTSNGGQIQVEQRFYAHRLHKNVIIHEADISIATPSLSLQHVCFASSPGSISSDIAVKSVPSFDIQAKVFIAQTNVEEVKGSGQATIAIVTTDFGSLSDSMEASPNAYNFTTGHYCATLLPGETHKSVRHVTVILTSLDNPLYINNPTMMVSAAADLWVEFTSTIAAENLLVEHTATWLALWSGGGIELSGKENAFSLARTINSSLYYILSSIRSDWPYGLSPGSLSSNSYNGHMFWDQETWMWPALALLFPAEAEACLQYRFNRLAGAEIKAASYSPPFKGAMFPWEDAFSGQETCPTSAPTGQLEQHISGDIAFAVRQMHYLSNNTEWLSSVGWPLVKGIAQFWASKAVPCKSYPGKYCINNVIPPDEYAVNVNNSAYTNVIASIALDFATEAAADLDESADPLWQQISQNMFVPFDTKRGIHLEYDTYNGEQIKQADVVLLAYPLEWSGLTPESQLADLLYYEPKTDSEGPAMAWAMHCIGHIDTGNFTAAAELLDRSRLNSQEPFGVWTEVVQPKPGGAVNFITGAGAFLQAMIFGYPGTRIRNGRLDFVPSLPDGVEAMRLRGVDFHGFSLDVYYEQSSAGSAVAIEQIPNAQIHSGYLAVLDQDGNLSVIPVGTSVKVPFGAFSILALY